VSSLVLINSSAATNLFNLTVEQGGVPNLTFGNVSVVNGGTGAGVTNTLQSNEATNNLWTITSANGGSYSDTQTLTFSNFADLAGGTGTSNNFVLAGGSVASLVGGGAGSNTLTGDNSGDTFTINAANGGSLAVSGGATLVTNFSGIQNLVGGGGADRFALVIGGSVSGTVNGGSGANTLDYSGLGSPISVTLTAIAAGVGTGTATAIGGSFSGISILTGSSSASNQLTGPNQSNTWTLTGADAGNVDGFQFSSIGNLTGGNTTNAFVLAGGSLSGNLDGGSGAPTGNSLQGDNVANTWNLTGANQGTVTGIGGTFSNIGTLIGGSSTDDFIFANNASLSGTLDGGGGNDTLDWSAYTSARNVVIVGPGSVDGMQGTEASIAGGFDNIAIIVGANGAGGLLNALTGPNSSNTWNVTASNAGNLDGVLAFSNFQTLNGGTAADTFNLAAGVGGSINGGGGGDTANIVSSFTAPAATLSINNVGAITDTAGAVVTAGTLAISGASSIGTAANPLHASLTALQIANSSGTAFIDTVGSVDLQGINLASGSLTLASGGAITDSSGQSITAGTVNLSAVSGMGTSAAPLMTAAANLNAVVSGAGDINIKNAGAMVLGVVSTANGNIDLLASGALAVNGPVTSGGSGAITLVTSSGDLTTNGAISASGSGNVNLDAAGNLNLVSSVTSGSGSLLLTGGAGITGNSSGVLHGNLINLTATTGNITLVGSTAGAPAGTVLTAPGNITLQGFTTNSGLLTIQNGGSFAVTGPVTLAGGLTQTGAGGVALASSITSGGNVQFGSPVTVSTASITTAGGNIDFNQAIAGSGGGSSLALSSGAGAIDLQAVSNLGSLILQTAGVLSLGDSVSVADLLTSGVTGGVVIAGASVSISTANSNVNFSSASGINALTAGGQALAINSGSGNVVLPATGQTAALASLSVSGSSITLTDVTTTGAQTYNGALQLGGNLSSTVNGGIGVNGNLALLSNAAVSASGAGAISISGTVNGGHALSLSTPSGNIALTGGVGSSTALSSLTLASAGANLGSVTTAGTQDYQVGTTRLAGVLNSVSGGVNFTGILNVTGNSVIQANTIGFNGGSRSVQGNTTLTLIPETRGLTVNIGGSSSGLTLNNAAIDGYDGALYIGTGQGSGGPDVIQIPVAAGNINVNGSLSLGSSGSLTLVGMGNLMINSGVLSANTVTLVAGSQNSVMQNPGAASTQINANLVVLVSGAQVGLPGAELNIQTSGSTPQVQIATGAIQSYLFPPTLPVVIGPAATIADAIALELGLNIQANSQVTTLGQQIVALELTGGLLESGFVDVSLFQNITLYDISGPGITLPFDQCERNNKELCN
ncbi:MAG: hypothetical protein KGQ73_07595, partial [Gammaproteobacteria bacterium]|nr:hypothetical protein [Gammaproteobacteria bacterium]